MTTTAVMSKETKQLLVDVISRLPKQAVTYYLKKVFENYDYEAWDVCSYFMIATSLVIERQNSSLSTISKYEQITNNVEQYRADTRFGALITIEGLDMAGKTTNMDFIVDTIRPYLNTDRQLVKSREPGGSSTAEAIRNILLSNKLLPITELYLFAIARNEHLHEKIFPNLLQGNYVVCDRFLDSSLAYQGYGRGLIDEVETFNDIICGKFRPKFTLFLTVTDEEAARRMKLRRIDINHFDNETKEFKQKIKQGYYAALNDERNKNRIIEVNANGSLDEVQTNLKEAIDKCFSLPWVV